MAHSDGCNKPNYAVRAKLSSNLFGTCMNEDTLQLLMMRRLPGRLTPEQVANLTGFSEHDIPILVRAKLLKALGNPSAQAVKRFSSAEIQKCAASSEWLHKATKTIYLHWENQNNGRRSRHTPPGGGGLSGGLDGNKES